MDRDAAEEAAGLLALRHPMVRAGIESTHKLNWVDKFKGPTIVWCENGLPQNVEKISLTDEPGVRAFFAVEHQVDGQVTTDVLFQVHHALFDGRGGLDLIRDFFIAYSNLLNGCPVTDGLSRLDPDLLRRRNRLGLCERNYLRHLVKQPIAFFGVTKFLFRKFFQLKSTADESPGETVFPNWRGMWLDADQTERMMSQVNKRNIALNSFLFGSLFVAIEDWKSEVQGGREDEWIRLILPMDYRDREFMRMPAANRSTIVQIDRRTRQIRSESTFYHYLDREISIIRGWRFDTIFLMLVRAMSFSTAWLRRSASNPKSRGTAIFTNLSEPLRWARKKGWLEPDGKSVRFGNLTVVEFDLTGPVRNGTPLNLCVQKHGRGMRLTVQWEQNQLGSEDVNWILERFVKLVTGE